MKRQKLLKIVDDLQEPLLCYTFSIPVAELPDYFNKTGKYFIVTSSASSPQHKDLTVAEHYAAIAQLMVSAIRNGAKDQDQENDFLNQFSHLIMHTILQSSPQRRRAYILLGILSAELSLTTVQPLVNAVQLELSGTQQAGSREALSVILSLSMTTLPDALTLLKLSLAICTYPIAPIASAGLHLLLRCLIKVRDEESVAAFENRLIHNTQTWSNLQRLVGLDASPNLILCLSTFMLHTLRITREKALIKKVIHQLLDVYHAKVESETERSELGPPLLLLCALSDSLQEMIGILTTIHIGNSEECRSCEQALQQLFTHLHLKDDERAVVSLSILMSLLATAETTEEQIKALKTMAVAAHHLPRAFQTIFDDMRPFLRSILQRSNNLPLLKAVQEVIIAEKRADERQGTSRLSDVAPDKDIILRDMGFDCFTRDWDLASDGQQEAHKNCISKMIISKET